MRTRPLIWFFLLAYAVTWLLWAPVVILGLPVFSESTHAPSLYMLPGVAVGVTGSAFLMTALTQGRPGVRRLLERLTLWRVGLQWYAAALLMIPVGELLVTATIADPGALRALTPAALLSYPAAYAAHFFFGPLFEESGWRGFALPRMQRRFGPLRATLYLGLLWSAWHFFIYVPVWISGGIGDGVAGAAGFTVTTTAMTVLFTWLFNNTKGSLLLAILLHGSVDGTATYLQVLADKGVISKAAAATTVDAGLLIACVVFALLVLLATRGRLSYRRYHDAAEQLDVVQPAR